MLKRDNSTNKRINLSMPFSPSRPISDESYCKLLVPIIISSNGISAHSIISPNFE